MRAVWDTFATKALQRSMSHAEGAEDAEEMNGAELDRITGEIVGAAYKLHTALGPSLLESVYEIVLARDLERRGLVVQRQVALSFEYEGLHFREALRIDLLVEHTVVVEIKSVEKLAPVHRKQVLTYLRLLRLPVGLLLNFGAAHLKDGLQRIVNGFPSGSAEALRVSLPQFSASSASSA